MKYKIIDLIYNLDSRPAFVNRDDIDVRYEDEYLDIIMFGNYHIKLYYDEEDKCFDVAFCDCGGAYGKQDLKYAAEIMDNREEILEIDWEDE